MPSSGRREWPSGPAVSILLLVAVCAVTFFAGLGTTALWEPDEPRFAEATRQMLVRHDFVTPWFNERPRFEKPILLYWLQLPFVALLGSSEVAARAPAALTGLLAVLAIFGLGREMVSNRTGVLAAVILATTFRFVVYARQGLTDVPVTAAITCGLWAMGRAIHDPRGSRARAWIAWACAGAGVLLKGPVALLAPTIWSLWALSIGGRPALMRTRPLSGLLILAAIAAPWFVVMLALHGRAFLDVAMGYEVIARYFSADFPGPDRGILYYWGVWLGDGLPWSIFLPPAMWWAFSSRGTLRAGESRAMHLAGIWFVVVLVIFSASQYKLPHYILPAYPAMSLAVGIFANAAIESRTSRWLWQAPAWLSAGALAACAVLLWLLMSRVFDLALPDPGFLLPVFLAAGSIVVGAMASPIGGPRPGVTFSLLAVVMAVCYGFLSTVVARRELRRFQPIPVLAETARRVVHASEPLAVAGNYGAPGLIYYARHPVVQLTDQTALVTFLTGDGRRHCVLPESELQQVRPLVQRPLRVQARAEVFSVRMKRLLEREPERAGRVLLLITAE
jgi:4-amino-4-deoxy-L-arabinose transferase-like glycosyltransferase